MRSSPTTRIAAAAILVLLAVTGTLVLITDDVRVEHLGPVMVLGVALVAVLALVLSPTSR